MLTVQQYRITDANLSHFHAGDIVVIAPHVSGITDLIHAFGGEVYLREDGLCQALEPFEVEPVQGVQSVTFITIEGRNHLEGVAQWLEAGAPHVEDKFVDGFNMSTGIENDGCGTTCCIAGAVVQFHRPTNLDNYEFANWPSVEQEAIKLLGISDEVAEELFNSPYDSEVAPVTPEIAAKVIRNFLASGVVDWNIEQ